MQSICNALASSPLGIRLLAFLLCLVLLWLPGAALIMWGIQDSNLEGIGLLAWALPIFLIVARGWGYWVYGHSQPLKAYGLIPSRRNGKNFLAGFCLGSISLFALFGIQFGLGWVSWQNGGAFPSLLRVALEGGLVAIAIGFGEELVFRGWLLDELERDYRPAIALWASSLTFAFLHFIKPLAEIWRTAPQFPGLVLLGLILVWARRSQQGRLGFPIGLHAGLVWGYYLVQVGERVVYLPEAPPLWSGVDQNPLAGGLGLLMLVGLAIAIGSRVNREG